MARIRCLLAVGRSQEALAETILCLTLCQRLQIDPPLELPELFAETVARAPVRESHRPAVHNPPARPEQQPPTPPPAVVGKLPKVTYPQANPHPKLADLPSFDEQPVSPMGPPRPLPNAYDFPPPPPGEGGPPGY